MPTNGSSGSRDAEVRLGPSRGWSRSGITERESWVDGAEDGRTQKVGNRGDERRGTVVAIRPGNGARPGYVEPNVEEEDRPVRVVDGVSIRDRRVGVELLRARSE